MKSTDLEKATELFGKVEHLRKEINGLNKRAASLLEKDQKVEMELIFESEKKEQPKEEGVMPSGMPPMPQSLMDFLSKRGQGAGASMLFGGMGGAGGMFEIEAQPNDEDIFDITLDEVEALMVIQSLINIKKARLEALSLQLHSLGVIR